MTRVAHGAFTKNTAKAIRLADERAEDGEDDSDSGDDDGRETNERRDEPEGDDGEDDAADNDDGEDGEDDGSEDEEDLENELEELRGDGEDEIVGERKARAKRNRYVDDVADEDDDDDDDGGAKKKKKKRGVRGFIDDEAEADDSEEDEEDEGEEDEQLDDEEREALRRDMDTRMHARMENQGAFERMDNEEEIERMIKERYAQPRYADAGRGQIDDSVDQQALHPTVRDPKLWMVTVKLGKERETTVCLMQKMINLAKQGKPPMQIFSAVCQDHLKGYIYVEAHREDHVRKALQGLRHVYHSKPIRLVPIKEMVDSISVVQKEVAVVKVDSWVRMRTGVYKGDLAQVIDVNYADNQCTVKLVPRIDYQHLADKEAGVKGKPKSQVRPPARPFSESEAKRFNLPLEKGRLDRAFHDVVDILCGTTKIKDGYHLKTCSLATVKLSETPTLDELQRFAVGEDVDTEGGAANGALAALSKAVGARKTDLKFMTGDQVLIVEGDLRNLEGVVERVDPDGRVVVMPSHKELNELLTFKPEQLRKHFKTGSTVRVLHGKHEGVVGMVVKVDRDVAHIFSTVSNEEFQVFMHDLADSEEATQHIDTIGEFALHDLAMLDGNEVGCIVRVEKDVAFVMTNAGTSDRPEIKPVKLHDLKKKLFSRNISAQDAHMDTIDQGSMVRIIDGKYKDATGTVEHIYKGTLWIRARHVQEHGGIVCIRSRNCVAHGGNKGSQIGGGVAAQMMSASGLPPKSPAHALLASSFTSGLRGDLMAQGNQAPRAMPMRAFAGGRGRGRDPLIGQTKKIRSGVYKGYVGRIIDVTDSTVRMELQAQARTITVNREHLDVPQVAASRDSFLSRPPPSGFDAPWARTPAHYPQTPARAGGMTPMHGAMTPAREAAWNPQQTPAHMPSEWQPTSTAGTGWGSGTGYTPGGFGDSAALAGPTPGAGYGVTPGADYTGATPGGYGITPGGYDAPRVEDPVPVPAAPVAAWPEDYMGRFIPGVVVRLSSGAQGYVTSVGPGGSTFQVKIGTVRVRDGVEVLETVPKTAQEETVTEDELEIVKPENKSRVIVVTAAEGANRGETGRLISIDGVDGVLRLDSSSDVVILDMACLARRWHE